eukprot:1179648-Pleurochrysis_carterae.AAC.1
MLVTLVGWLVMLVSSSRLRKSSTSRTSSAKRETRLRPIPLLPCLDGSAFKTLPTAHQAAKTLQKFEEVEAKAGLVLGALHRSVPAH